MKKWICFFLILGMAFTACPAYAQSEQIEYELDARVSPLLLIESQTPVTIAGDVTFTTDGRILLQQIALNSYDQTSQQEYEPQIRDRLYIKLLEQNGDVIASSNLSWATGNARFTPYTSFVGQDPNGRIYTSSKEKLFLLDPNLNLLSAESHLPFSLDDQYEIDLQGKTTLIAQRSPPNYNVDPNGEEYYFELNYIDHISIIPFANETDTLLSSMITTDAENLASLFGRSASVMEVDFAETEDTLYVLVYDEGGNDEEPIWKIAKVKVTLNQPQDPEPMEFELLESFTLKDVAPSDIGYCYEFDGENHQVLFWSNLYYLNKYERPKLTESTLCQYDNAGNLIDSVKVPGYAYAIDAKGSKTVIALNDPYRTGNAGHYMVNWTPPSTGSPSALIHERTMKGKTMAIFRDKGYGLLRKENPDTGIIDYLAPLKTEESDVRLRIPLCDIVAKIQDDAQNLEILYGNDRIDIPMSQLDVRDLLSQMPCETDATIELHLTRDADGTVQTTAELFVVEQVNAQTKRVHRLPFSLQ